MSLDKLQAHAAGDQSSDVCIVAGPGSGKSTTLAAAIRNDASAVPAAVISFTNAAANEIRMRIGTGYNVGYCGTLHGFCFSQLRLQNPKLLLIDEDESKRLLTLTAEKLRYKGSQKALEEARENFWMKGPQLGQYSEAQRVVLAFSADLIRENLLEYDLLLARMVKYIMSGFRFPKVRFFVDEFQDSANVDMAIYQNFPHSRLFVVGDIDQCIFTFRGANPQNMLEFYGRASQHVLNYNYRSTPQIVASANWLISCNKVRVPLQMEAKRYLTGPIPTAFMEQDEAAHDMRVAEIVGSHLGQGIRASEIAVLCRTNNQVHSMQTFLRLRGMVVADPRGEDVPDMARVRTLVGLALNPTSSVLNRVDMSQRRSTGALVGTWRLQPATTVKEVLNMVRDNHAYSDPMKLIIAQIEEECPSNEPHRIFEYLRNREVHERRPGVQVGTMHWSKGQQFEIVVIAHADDRPDVRHDEEDRRLFYVAMTRAKYAVYVVGAANRYVEFQGRMKRALTPFVLEANFHI